MTEGMGLRERKKRETRRRLLETATTLFSERGFDQVSVAEIADAADVSKMTVFNYFDSKEDLVFAPLEEHVGDAAQVVRDRAPGESAVAAIRRQFIEAIERHDPSVGMGDKPLALGIVRLIMETPALLTRAHSFFVRTQDQLTEALIEEGEEPVVARIVAAQILGTRNALLTENRRRLLAGEPSAAVAADAIVLAHRGFDLLEKGLGAYATRA
ncbi:MULTISPECIES: TetR/AcrR family transcriptional regulator [unclassified Streptomyces]|uniref:TetR/AcrR family transcriptional regulator n=1 Tax=unclassified Streptomyces TaxID=2593676 RepID=UPI0003768CAA|nr:MULTISPECIES: TetR/AcrR family transcriptional regulator [unclassified Streptomyces]MYS33766.1 TetR family transcriptional regulator [Streptomyces sp. SID4920]MYX70455.1 TetR family transcriptional regulator [Streptomyces sp. SID8373]